MEEIKLDTGNILEGSGRQAVVPKDSAGNMEEIKLDTGNILEGSGRQADVSKEDEEMRKEKRKQANREAAKRSRLRKQEECRKLQATVDDLKAQSSMLKNELLSLCEECSRLEGENNSIMEELKQTYGPDAISSLLALMSGLANGKTFSSGQTTPSQENSTPNVSKNSSNSSSKDEAIAN